MTIWSGEIKELDKLHESFTGQLTDLEKELEQLIITQDANVVMLYSRRCLEVIVSDLCEGELKRPRKTEPLKGIIDKLNSEEKVPSHIITSMHGLNSLSVYGTHPKDFDPEQVKPVLNNLVTIIKWYLKYKDIQISSKKKVEKGEIEIKSDVINSIAVLPFANMSSDPEQEYFSDGISEEIINMLAQVPGLKVAGRTSAFSFKGMNQDLRHIGGQLNVNHILEGSVRKSGNKIRITAQLIKVADGYHVWSEKYDRELEDIFDIQDEISLAILNAIKIKLFGAAKEALLKKYTDNTEAYQLYLHGRFYYNKSGADGFNKAIDYYTAAIKIEPDYALAYAGIGYSYLYLWFFNYSPPEKCLPLAKQSIQQCLQLDNEISESHSVLGVMKLLYEWDFAEASIEFKKAIALNPNYAEAHFYYAMGMAIFGNHKEAIKHASIAYNLDPFSLWINLNVGVVYMLMGDYEKELEFGRKLIELEPSYFGGHLLAGGGLMNFKRYEAAVPECEIAVHLSYGSLTLRYLGLIYGLVGEKVKAREVLEKMENLITDRWVGNFDMSIVYMALGEFENAFKYFEKAIEKHEGTMIFLQNNIRHFPEFEQDPRTKQLLEKIGLPYQ
jgi:adenylate cyclase